MKIKIIDLLVKIANGEEVPKTIRWYDEFYNDYDEISNDYKVFVYEKLKNNVWDLNDEVEIIEEPKKIEKIARCDNIRMTHYGEIYQPTENQEILRIKINELIDEINNLKEK